MCLKFFLQKKENQRNALCSALVLWQLMRVNESSPSYKNINFSTTESYLKWDPSCPMLMMSICVRSLSLCRTVLKRFRCLRSCSLDAVYIRCLSTRIAETRQIVRRIAETRQIVRRDVIEIEI